MKDHEIAQLVNALRDCAVEFHNAQQLRERIAALVVPALQGLRLFARMRFGYAPGDYVNVCITCKRMFIGDRRSHVCDQCADAACAAQLPELQQRSVAVGAESAALWGRALFADALQQSSSGITAGAEKPSQVVDCGAAAQTRTGDLLITNQDKNTSETSQNQDVTQKTAPAQPAQVAPTESNGCEGVTATPGMWRMLSDLLDGHQLPESLNRAIHALCAERAVVVPSTPTVAAMFGCDFPAGEVHPVRTVRMTFRHPTLGDDYGTPVFAAAHAEFYAADPRGMLMQFTASNGCEITVENLDGAP